MKRNRKTEKPRLVVGLMSGTSVDGIDAALVRISSPPNKPSVRLVSFQTTPYRWWLKRRLLRMAGGKPTTVAELGRLNRLLGEIFADAASQVCQRGGVASTRLFVIGSHGQTVFHYGGMPREVVKEGDWAVDVDGVPELQEVLDDPVPIERSDLAYITRPSTLQIGEPALIAEMTGAPVVADFRVADTAAGGQGAPLVPMVDYLLLRSSREGRVALNIGGISNVTVIPARAKPQDVFGFDTGPGNIVMDALVRHFTKGRESYDADGRVASRGKISEPILADALEHPFFAQQPPKSAGREQFGAAFLEGYFLERRRRQFKDLLRTATELTARSIFDALELFVFPRAKIHRLIVSGGGAHNRFLLKRLRELLPQLKVDISDRYGLPVDAKEAIAFAVLADRTMHGLPGNLPSVTGADRPVVLGKIVSP